MGGEPGISHQPVNRRRFGHVPQACKYEVLWEEIWAYPTSMQGMPRVTVREPQQQHRYWQHLCPAFASCTLGLPGSLKPEGSPMRL